jgi:hypothetical protein
MPRDAKVIINEKLTFYKDRIKDDKVNLKNIRKSDHLCNQRIKRDEKMVENLEKTLQVIEDDEA